MNRDKILQIKNAISIEEVIGEYINLTKKGNNFVGLCPFHDDKNPSLSVSPKQQIYKCFSCNEGGDVFRFLEKHLHITPMEAIRKVAKKVGIVLELTQKEIEHQKYERHYKLLKEAGSFFNFFLKATEEGTLAKKYLQNRGISEEMIDTFSIGLSEENGTSLTKMLKDKGFSELELVEVNLNRFIRDKLTEVFSNRIIFPLHNNEGDIVGFSGRIFSEKDKHLSKYINTEETPIFHKGEFLYNYFRLKNAREKYEEVYLLEGFMDVLALYKADIINSVASMGTSLTNFQASAINSLFKSVVIAYDGDQPGILAIKRAIPLLRKAGVKEIFVLIWPDNLDPDDFFQKEGKEKLREFLITKRVEDYLFLYNQYKLELNPESLISVENFKEKIFDMLKMFPSLVITQTVLKRLSNDIKIDFEILFDVFNKYSEKTKFLTEHFIKKDEIENNCFEDIKIIPESDYYYSINNARERHREIIYDIIRLMYTDEGEKNLQLIFKKVDFNIYYKHTNLVDIYTQIYEYFIIHKTRIPLSLLIKKLNEKQKSESAATLEKIFETKIDYPFNFKERFDEMIDSLYIYWKHADPNDLFSKDDISLNEVENYIKDHESVENITKEEVIEAFSSETD